MTTQTHEVKSNTAERTQKTQTQTRTRSSNGAGVWLLVCLLLAVLGAGGYGWKELTHSVRNLAHQQNAFSEKLIQSEEETSRKINHDIQPQLDQLKEQEQRLLSTLQRLEGANASHWQLLEVDYGLKLASYRLLLGDVATAKQLVKSADERLLSLQDPSLNSIREALANDLGALNALSTIDLLGLWYKVGSLMEQVPKLKWMGQWPRSVTEHPEKSTVLLSSHGGLKADFLRAWQEVKSLITIRKHSQVIEPLLSEQQGQWLHRQLLLKLEQVRVALITQEVDLFRATVESVKSFLHQYVDLNDTVGKSFLETLVSLQGASLELTVPSLEHSRTLIRQTLQARDIH